MDSRREKSEGSAEYVDTESENEVQEAQSKRPRKGDDDSSHYEQIRDQRIKENMERMQKLGLLNLSRELKKRHQQKKSLHYKKKTTHDALPPNQSPPRRSSRIMTLAPVNYSEGLDRQKHDSATKDDRETEIVIPEGTNPEFYSEEQEKLLGDCETIWELYVDGYDIDGNRIYDPIKGETCHQCRQKTICQHTSCNKCELPQGQLCGDCLYTRYGENVIEATRNPKWECPCCRGICNCSRCRKANGWMPTGNIYRKVSKLGFKSVAHYLIQTRRSETPLEGSGAENIAAEEISETSAVTTLNRLSRTRRALRS